MASSGLSEKKNLSLHIAVCDDNVGDRKQLERLLSRESDSRAHETGVFYIDSYGNAKAVMQSPMLYDAFFIDMVSGDTDGTSLTHNLLNAGVTAPIILCISSVNYREALQTVPDKDWHNIFYMDKPLRKAALSEMLDMCVDRKSQKIMTIELRGEKDTRYVAEDDIAYAKLDGNYVNVYLKDGSLLKLLCSLDNFYSQLASFSHYAAVNSKSMVNICYVKSVSPFRLTMTNGMQLRTTPGYSKYIKAALRQYTEEL